jgi:putative membrane protein
LIALGVGLLVVGIVYHVQFMTALRTERELMKGAGLVHAESVFPIYTLILAILLLLLGVTAFVSLTLDIGPFS